jgi:hypothetical protein
MNFITVGISSGVVKGYIMGFISERTVIGILENQK